MAEKFSKTKGKASACICLSHGHHYHVLKGQEMQQLDPGSLESRGKGPTRV